MVTVCLLGVSCATVRTTERTVVERTVTRHDTLWQHDSVYVSRTVRQAQDTVYVHDTLIRYGWRDRVVVRTDSVPVVQKVEVVRTAERKRSGYDRFCSLFFWMMVLAVGLRVLWALRRNT